MTTTGGRTSGILLHPTSLPSPWGVGDLGAAAHRFVDRLAETRQRWWQILPLTPPGYGGSPYSALSAFALNPALIDPEDLRQRGWLGAEELERLEQVGRQGTFRVEEVSRAKMEALDAAWRRWAQADSEREGFESFCEQQSYWLDDYALYIALRQARDGAGWQQWPEPLVRREPQALEEAKRTLAAPIERCKFRQWIVAAQWDTLRAYAAERGVGFIGDIPIFVAMDSADVWARRKLFLVDQGGRAERVAGVPPDYFSKLGQKWGNPLYDWQALEHQEYDWWIDRIKRTMEQVDLIRIDHFRGFESYWAVPAEAPDARTGEWREGPGDAFFEAVRRQLGQVPLIAEDLGMITDEVLALRDRWELPGMKVLQFAFGEDKEDHPFRPHTYPRRAVAYTGTHDNDTSQGWYDGLDAMERHRVRRYLHHGDEGIVWAMIEALLRSQAELVIVPAQDVLELGSEARMNTPGTDKDNWRWRLTSEQLEKTTPWQRLAALTEKHGRRA